MITILLTGIWHNGLYILLFPDTRWKQNFSPKQTLWRVFYTPFLPKLQSGSDYRHIKWSWVHFKHILIFKWTICSKVHHIAAAIKFCKMLLNAHLRIHANNILLDIFMSVRRVLFTITDLIKNLTIQILQRINFSLMHFEHTFLRISRFSFKCRKYVSKKEMNKRGKY